MDNLELSVKNMVCDRCIMVVKSVFEDAGIPVSSITLGHVLLSQPLTADQSEAIRSKLEQVGFEVLDDRRSKLIEAIKAMIIKLVHHSDDERNLNLSALLSAALHLDYKYLSTLFSGVEGVTIEKYYIRQKIEKAKELLVYDERSLSQIADDLGYSSVAHLSSQFRQVTGITPTQFKKSLGDRTPLDKV